ncbi:MAG: YkgJ family cysteine cluster protein [Vampirovibrionia bacterium]
MSFDFNFYSKDDEGREPLDPLPQGVCNQCGKCCRSATTFYPYKKLLEFVEQGEQEAIDFLSIFEPYPSIEEARKVIPDQVDNVLRVVEYREDMNVEDVTFYHCRYINDQNLCTAYETRPRCCREAPRHGWSLMPPGCGFEAWQFEQREKQKKLVRELKESLYLMEQMSPDGKTMPTRDGVTLDELRAIIEAKIAPWKRFGADLW